jgi:hypothetical protein
MIFTFGKTEAAKGIVALQRMQNCGVCSKRDRVKTG